VGPLRNTASDA